MALAVVGQAVSPALGRPNGLPHGSGGNLLLSLRVSGLVVFAGLLAGAEHRGSVKSAGLPIPGAVVTAVQGERSVVTSTDESGTYLFEDLAPGSWSLTVEAFGFEKSTRPVALPADAAVSWNLELRLPRMTAAPSAAVPRLGVNQTVQSDVLAELSAPIPSAAEQADLSQNANESFLVTGSLSRGLQAPRQEDMFLMMGRPGMMPGLQGGANPFGEQGDAAAMAGPGGRPVGGPPGMGGGPPGMMGGGPRMGGPGGFGGGGGPGGGGGGGRGAAAGGQRGGARPGARGPAGQQRPEWQGRPGAMIFGNRANRGRDAFRGMGSFSLRNSALDAQPYSLTGQNVEKPSYGQARFSLNGGGQLRIPKLIRSDQTFFFVNYFGTRSRNPVNSVATLPSALERGGDFSQSIARGPVVVYDPLTQQPFPDGRIPSSRINAAAAGLASFIPAANLPGRVQNYQLVTSVPQNSDNLGIRMFHTLSRRERIGGSFNLQSRSAEAAQLYGFRDHTSGRGLSADLSWTHTIRTGLINTLRWNFSRNRTNTAPFFAYGRNVAAELGIAGTSQNPANYGPPNLSFTNFGGLSDASASLRRDQTSSVAESVLFVRRRHTLSAGVDYRRSQLNNRSDQNGRGTFAFSGIATSGFDAAGQPLAGTGFDFADFLLGLPQSSSIRFGSADTYFRGAAYSAFVQDDFRIRPNLTLNLGLRYEYQRPVREKYNRMANLDVAPGFTAVAPVLPGAAGPYTGVFPQGLVEPDRNNLAPRFAVAWRPSSKRSTLLRAGYSWYFNGSVYNQAASRLAQQPPFANTASTTTSLAHPLTIQNGFDVRPSTDITNTYAVDRFYRAGYAQTWSLSVQQTLPEALMIEVGYLGTKGTRLDIQRLPNRAAPGSPLTAEERRQIGNAAGFTFDSSEGNSIYHAGQVRLTRRFRRGVSAGALYTFGKSIDNASTFGGGGATVAQNDKDLRAERGLSSFDRRHTLDVFYMLMSPAGIAGSSLELHGLAGKLLKDWSLSGSLSVRSGAPFTATALGNRSDSGGTGAVGAARADSTGLPVTVEGAFFNPAAFALPPAGRFGNASRNTIPGPWSVVMNIGVGRSFRLDENRHTMELRMESNNTLNAVNISRLGTTVNASNYGLPLDAGGMRTMQASLRFRF